MFYYELIVKSFYQTSIRGMILKLLELKAEDGQV